MTVNAITDTKKGRTGIAPTYLHTTRSVFKTKFSQCLHPSFIFVRYFTHNQSYRPNCDYDLKY